MITNLSWTVTFVIVAACLVLTVIILIAIYRRKKQTSTPLATTTTPPAATTGTTPPTAATAKTTVTKTTYKTGTGWSFGTAATLLVAGLVIWIILAGLSAIIKEFRSQPEVRQVVRVQSSQSEAPRPALLTVPSMADLAPQAPAKRFKPLTVYRDHEVMLPPETKNAVLKTRNTTDVFAIRGELRGKKMWSLMYGGKADEFTPFPKADTWYIRCVNRDLAYVDFVEPGK